MFDRLRFKRNGPVAERGVELSDMSNSRTRTRPRPTQGNQLPQLNTPAPLPSFQRHIPIGIRPRPEYQSTLDPYKNIDQQDFATRSPGSSRTGLQAPPILPSTPRRNAPRNIPIIPIDPSRRDSKELPPTPEFDRVAPDPERKQMSLGHDFTQEGPFEDPVMPKGWKRDYDLLICYMDRYGFPIEMFGKKLREVFPDIKIEGGMPSAAKLQVRLEALEFDVDVNYWRSDELERRGLVRKQRKTLESIKQKSTAVETENLPVSEGGLTASVETYHQPSSPAHVVQIPRARPSASNSTLRAEAVRPSASHSTLRAEAIRPSASQSALRTAVAGCGPKGPVSK